MIKTLQWSYLVDNALQGARIRKGTISAGYSHVIPSQPKAKNVLKTNKNTAWAAPAPELPFFKPQ